MSRLLTAKVFAGITGSYGNTLGSDAGNVNHKIDFEKTLNFTTGTAVDQAQVFWGDKARVLTSGNNDDIDLYDGGAIDIGPGAGRDPLGFDLANAEIVALYLFNHLASAGSLVIGAAATNPWTAIFGGTAPTVGPIPPNGFITLGAAAAVAWAVADASNNILRINASGGDVTYDIALLARLA